MKTIVLEYITPELLDKKEEEKIKKERKINYIKRRYICGLNHKKIGKLVNLDKT